MTTWQALLTWLASAAITPDEVNKELPRSGAAVAAAYAGFLPTAPAPAPAPPAPAPKDCPCGGSCKGTGIYRPDGRIEMRCLPGCKTCGMKSVLQAEAPCPDGKCRKPAAR